MKSDFSVQNNVVNVCCSHLSMVFPYIGNVKYQQGRTYQQQRFKSKRRKIENGQKFKNKKITAVKIEKF